MAYIDCENEDQKFLAIISSNYLEDEMEYFKDRVEGKIDKNVNFLYIYDGSNKRQDLEYLLTYEGLDFANNPSNYKRTPFNIEGLKEQGVVDKEAFLLELEEYMKARDERDDNVVYMTIDGIWMAENKEEIESFYASLKELGDRYGYRYIIRYILNELNRGYIYGMMMEHKYVLLRRKDGLKIYTSRNLLSKSMSTFSYYSEVEEKYEEEMMRVEHLKSMGELTEGIVHDVNNIFATVLGSIELIKLNGYREENKEYIDTIYKSVAEGSGILNRVLSHMRGTKEAYRSTYSLNDIVKFCLDMSYIKLKNLGNVASIETCLDLRSRSFIEANQYDINQAILNIIFNAVDAMADGGNLYIRTYDEEDRAILEIEDTGDGMSVGTQERIFDAYYTTKGDLGTGIGLNMTKKICDSYGIDIELESKKGEGSKFILSFPRVEVEEEA